MIILFFLMTTMAIAVTATKTTAATPQTIPIIVPFTISVNNCIVSIFTERKKKSDKSILMLEKVSSANSLLVVKSFDE